MSELVSDGRLLRLGEGLYAKARPGLAGKGRSPGESLDLAREVFVKLGVRVRELKMETLEGRPVIWVDAGAHRVKRKLDLDGTPVRYLKSVSDRGAPLTLSTDVDALPTHHVQRFIEKFARAHGVSHVRTGLDDYAEAVTRTAGDEVKLDPTGKLLVALKRKDLIDGMQLARLMTSHLKELDGVRSVRRLRKRRLSKKHRTTEGSQGDQGPGARLLRGKSRKGA